MKKLIILSFVIALMATGCSLPAASKHTKDIGLKAAKAKATDFINNSLMQPGSKVSIKSVTKEEGLYKIIVNMPNGQEITSYLSEDGENFFPQVMNIAEYEKKAQAKKTKNTANNKQATANVPKANKPKVELFVMSYCPYGTQIEKGILPTLKTLGNKIDFKLKFCDYSMHGEKELKENLRQYCIEKNEPQKLDKYLECFLADSKSDECIAKEKINKGKVDACVKQTDTKYKVMANYADKSTWKGSFPTFNVYKNDNEKYGVKGSPTLVINGQQASSARDSASLLKTICAGFKTQPKECDSKLSSTAPAPGFGFKGSSADSSGGCGQ